MKIHPCLLIILAITIMDSCNIDTQNDLGEEEARIRILYPNWVKQSMDTRNPEDYFKGVTDDFIIMGCGFDPLTVDSIRLEVKKLLDSDFIIEIEDCQTKELIIRDDIAIHRYSCFEVGTSKADTTRKRFGFNYLDILKKTADNKWKIHLHMATEKP